VAAWDMPEAGRYATKAAAHDYLGVSIPPSGGMAVAQSIKRDGRRAFASLREIDHIAFFLSGSFRP
jgi:hypothetical protein